MVVVFDGEEDARLAVDYGGLRVRYSGTQSADQTILQQVGRGAGWTVVTNDRALQQGCRHRGAQVLTVTELADRLRPAPGPEPGAEADPRVDLDDWESFFSRDRDPS